MNIIAVRLEQLAEPDDASDTAQTIVDKLAGLPDPTRVYVYRADGGELLAATGWEGDDTAWDREQNETTWEVRKPAGASAWSLTLNATEPWQVPWGTWDTAQAAIEETYAAEAAGETRRYFHPKD